MDSLAKNDKLFDQMSEMVVGVTALAGLRWFGSGGRVDTRRKR